MFYCINGRLPYTDGYLFVPDGEPPAEIIKEKLSLKELFIKFFRIGSNGLVSSLFLAALLLVFATKETLAKEFLAELYKSLTVEVLSSDNSENLQFDALTDLCVTAQKTIFPNSYHKKSKNTKKISTFYQIFR